MFWNRMMLLTLIYSLSLAFGFLAIHIATLKISLAQCELSRFVCKLNFLLNLIKNNKWFRIKYCYLH